MKIFNILPGNGSTVCEVGKLKTENRKPDANPLWFFMPDSTVLRSGNPFFVPEFDDKFEAFPSLAIKINRLGKSIAPRFVHRYFAEATFAMTVRASHLLTKLRTAGLPWTPAVCFDKSCHLGDFVDFKELCESGKINLGVGELNIGYSLDDIMERIENVISSISSDIIIKTGDIFLLPLAEEGITLTPGLNVNATVGDKTLLEIRIK